MCEYQCFEIGGPWVAENPECPVHGVHSEEVVKPCWRDAGLSESGAERAGAAIDRMVNLVDEVADADLARIILAEALFRVFELPKRTPAFRAKYKRENG